MGNQTGEGFLYTFRSCTCGSCLVPCSCLLLPGLPFPLLPLPLLPLLLLALCLLFGLPTCPTSKKNWLPSSKKTKIAQGQMYRGTLPSLNQTGEGFLYTFRSCTVPEVT